MSLLASGNVREFLAWLDRWYAALPGEGLQGALEAAGGPDRATVLCVDVVEGFCSEGPLASGRVASIVGPIADLFTRAHAAGVRNFLLPQDSHPPDSPEFDAYGPHCIAGTREAETVSALTRLPFADLFRVLPKATINSAIGTGLDALLDGLAPLRLLICVGDCTDLCLYQLAMHLRLRANAERRPWRVLVPADCVDTYHLPTTAAEGSGALPHEADLLHRVFLYHLALNGVDVVRQL